MGLGNQGPGNMGVLKKGGILQNEQKLETQISKSWVAVFFHNIYVLCLLLFVTASATAEYYENGFPQRPMPPECEVVDVPSH